MVLNTRENVWKRMRNPFVSVSGGIPGKKIFGYFPCTAISNIVESFINENVTWNILLGYLLVPFTYFSDVYKVFPRISTALYLRKIFEMLRCGCPMQDYPTSFFGGVGGEGLQILAFTKNSINYMNACSVRKLIDFFFLSWSTFFFRGMHPHPKSYR